MPPKKAKPRPVLWQVVGGKSSGGLIARKGPETKSAEHAERLSTDSTVRELEVQGERMRYQLVKGSGPETGWISTKFKGKDQLKTWRPRAWILATGTRGDCQPYLALALGMKEAGYDMTIWTCEDFQGFVENYGIRMGKISGPIEERIRKTTCKAGPGKSESETPDADEADQADHESLVAMWVGRWVLSLEYKASVGGVDALRGDPVPPEMEAKLPKKMRLGLLSFFCEVLTSLTEHGDVAARYASCAERLSQELAEEEAAAKACSSSEMPTDGAEPPEKQPVDWDALGRDCEAAPGSALARVMEEVWKVPDWGLATTIMSHYLNAKAYWVGGSYSFMDSLMNAGMDGIFIEDLAKDESVLKDLFQEVQARPPDIVLHNCFWYSLALALEGYLGVPSLCLHLQPEGITFGDPHAPWVTEDSYKTFQYLNPTFLEYPTLEEARRHHHVEEPTTDHGMWATQVVLEEVFMEPIFGCHPVRDMGPDRLFRRLNERHVVGFLSSIASERFQKFMGDLSAKQVAKHYYTGFWIMDDQQQTGTASSDMFGGPELMKQIEDFIAAGDPPAYIGWGSCVCSRGSPWMVALAVTALQRANMRGIILGGWAGLSMELLEAFVDGDDSLELLDYARRNVLFVKKVPQVWLFPRCSVIVIHGGVGTLAAAWTSGTPLIVCAVWLDQFSNSLLNTFMGAGVQCQNVDATTPEELARCLKAAITDPRVRQGAQAVQFSMAMDRGILTATEHIDSVLLEEVPSGRWQQWWM